MEKSVIGKKLKKYRNKHGKTQSDMAKEFGVSLTGYQMWERGISEPNDQNKPKVLDKIK